MTETEDRLVNVIQLFIAALVPFGARHKQDKCFCNACNNLRRVIKLAADTVAPLQPPEL